MKRLLYIFFVLGFIFSPILHIDISSEVQAGETPVDVDQYHTPMSSTDDTAVLYNYGWGQTFVPTVNRLSSVHVELLNRVAGSGMTVTVQDKITGQEIATSSHRMSGGDGWESFYFYPKKVMIPGNEHVLLVTTSNETTAWAWNTSPGYANGTRERVGYAHDGDFSFSTWGSTYTEDPPPEEPPAEEPDEDQPADAGDQESADSQGEDSDSSIDESADEAPVDESIDAPELEYIVKDEEPSYPPFDDEVSIEDEDSFKIAGTAEPSLTVVVFLEDTKYSTSADADGKWSVTIDPEDLDNGEYEVTAQAQDKAGKGSKIASFFKLTKGEVDTAEESTEDVADENPDYKRQWAGVAALVLIALVCGGAAFILWLKQKRERDQKQNKESQKSEKKSSKK